MTIEDLIAKGATEVERLVTGAKALDNAFLIDMQQNTTNLLDRVKDLYNREVQALQGEDNGTSDSSSGSGPTPTVS